MFIYRSFLFLLTLAALSVAVSSAADENLPVERIGASDLLSVLVYDTPELSRTVRVSPEGFIRLPLIAQPVRAEGLLPHDVEQEIAQALVKENLLVQPSVTVTIAEYRSRTITVGGAVRKPLTFQQTGAVRLMDALVRAEGVSPDAGPDVLVQHASAAAPGTPASVQRVSIRRLFDGDPSVNLLLESGDEVHIPAAEKVYVFGNVRKPGAFRYEDASQMTVRRILALSEGMLPYAGRTAWLYRREDQGTKEIPVEIAKILERKSDDVQLHANDVLYIPDNKGRRLTMTALDRLVSFGGATASGIIIWGR